ncbi:hypothetical protein MACH24_04660 [Erythrobacter sp. Dej080120_24]|uniref:PAS domain-containing protein n=1 Tax=Erythrobacter sp. Dej080120_24 TaxID=3024837 RepID=UPI002923635B|nr:hypothetical protein MACH24_04660 [Erythrobacter sp. Dej080120_24]
MDTLRGTFDTGIPADDSQDWDDVTTPPEEERVRELPPEAIGQDERRMQVRAYNHWAGLLGDANFPSIEELEPHNLDDFGPNSVLLDFTAGIEDPVVQFLGTKLAAECGGTGHIARLSDVPPRSLLSRITDHYMQILANQAPIGFEAEFVNQQGASILYRGILLPFSSDGETIDFIYGVINWKEMADPAAADELLLEIDQALATDGVEEVETEAEDQPHRHHADPLTEWADSPAHEATAVDVPQTNPLSDNISSMREPSFDGEDEDEDDLPLPDFGQYALDDPEVDEFGEEIEDEDDDGASYSFASLADYIEAPAKKAIDLDAEHFDPEDYRVEEPAPAAPVSPEPVAPEPATVEPAIHADFGDEADDRADGDGEDVFELAEALSTDAGLYDCLASARELAQTARASEDRSRHALYAAVGRAYDFSLAAADEPDAYAELIEDSGLTIQDRAPMTPIVKLVFGQDYDKTRLTEYAAVLAHAHRLELERGSLADYLAKADGGLKGVVNAERRLRREESGKEVEAEGDIRAQLAKKLRQLEEIMLESLEGEGPEFSLVMIRRDDAGRVALIGEIADDVSLIERAGKKLVG